MDVVQMSNYTGRYMSWIESVSNEVEATLDGWKSLSFYDEVFTESEEEAAAKDKLGDKAITGVQKIINAVKSIFKKIGEVIRNALAYFRADKDEKTKYKEFCERAKNDPTFAGKKITYADYSKALGVYRVCIDGAENDYRNFKDDQASNRHTVGDEISQDAKAAVEKATQKLEQGLVQAGKLTKEAGGELAASITVSALLVKCRNSQAECIEVMDKIKKNSIMIQMIEKELGKKEIRKMKRKIWWLNAKAKFLSVIGRARHHQALTLSEAVQGAIHGIDAVYGTKKDPKTKLGQGIEQAKELHRANQILNRTTTAKKVGRKAAMDAMGIKMDAKSQLRRKTKEAKRFRNAAAKANLRDVQARENNRIAEEKRQEKEARKAAKRK